MLVVAYKDIDRIEAAERPRQVMGYLKGVACSASSAGIGCCGPCAALPKGVRRLPIQTGCVVGEDGARLVHGCDYGCLFIAWGGELKTL